MLEYQLLQEKEGALVLYVLPNLQYDQRRPV